MNVLICDDTALMRASLKDLLTEAGHAVVAEAKNGEEAIEMFQNSKPDLSILDITMPGMDGITTLKRIRELDPGAKCIMCTGMGDQSFMIEAIQNGAIDFISKPFAPDRLVAALNSI